jgi:hypothetical protein
VKAIHQTCGSEAQDKVLNINTGPNDSRADNWANASMKQWCLPLRVDGSVLGFFALKLFSDDPTNNGKKADCCYNEYCVHCPASNKVVGLLLS